MKLHSKNLLSLVGYDAGTRLLGFAATAYVARVVGTEGFGILNYAMAFLSYAFLVASPGIHTLGTRTASQQQGREHYLVSDVTHIRLFLSLLVGILMVAGACWWTTNAMLRTIILLYATSLIPYALQLDWFFQGKEDVQSIGLFRFVAGAVYLAVILLTLRSPADLAAVPVAFSLAAAVNAAGLFFVFRHRFASGFPWRSLKSLLPQWKETLLQALPIGYGTMLSQLILSLPIILLGLFSSATEVGNFSAAWKIVFFLLAIDRGIYLLFYPLVSRTHAMRPDALPALLQRILRYVMLIVLPLSVGLIIVSPLLVDVIFGAGFAASAPMLGLLSLYFFFTILNSIFGYALLAVGAEKRYSYVMTLFSIATGIILVPLVYWKSGWGASCGMAAGEMFLAWLMFRETKKKIGLTVISMMVKPISAAIAMAGFVSFLLPYGLLVSVLSGVCIYTAIILLLRGITRDDFVFLKERFL